jgi:hypothetical protein
MSWNEADATLPGKAGRMAAIGINIVVDRFNEA